jgi:hypothetical protein
MGLWFGYDGFIGWPESNRKIEAIQEKLKAAEAANDENQAGQLRSELKEYKWRTNADLLLQRGLFFVLPLAGIGLLSWTLYRSRGEYRLEGESLSVPGHPVVQLNQITELKSELWDRKGIAILTYESGGKTGQITLDDFVYERKPTDAIYERVKASLSGGESVAVEPPPAPPAEHS